MIDLSRFEWISFDCYGTLVDWEGGIHRAFVEALGPLGVLPSRDEVIASHAEHEPAVQAERFRSYREVLTETARRMREQHGWPTPPGGDGFLAESLPRWDVFPDTEHALGKLVAQGKRLAILSNVDDDLIRGTLRHLEVPFEALVTAEQVGAYKPAAAHFLAARRRFSDAGWLHVAQSWFHDIVPATRERVPCVWINRKDERPGEGGEPLAIFESLAALVA